MCSRSNQRHQRSSQPCSVEADSRKVFVNNSSIGWRHEQSCQLFAFTNSWCAWRSGGPQILGSVLGARDGGASSSIRSSVRGFHGVCRPSETLSTVKSYTSAQTTREPKPSTTPEPPPKAHETHAALIPRSGVAATWRDSYGQHYLRSSNTWCCAPFFRTSISFWIPDLVSFKWPCKGSWWQRNCNKNCLECLRCQRYICGNLQTNK